MAVGIGEALDGAWSRFMYFFDIQSLPNPELFKVALLLVVGFVGGRILSDVVLRLLRMTRLDELGVKSDIQIILRKFNYRGSLSEFIADVLRWGVYALTLLALFNLFGSELVAGYSEWAMQWASKLILATFIIIIGSLIAERIGSIVVQVFRTGRITGRVDESHAEIPLYIVAGKSVKYIGYLVTGIIALAFLDIDMVVLYILTGVLALSIATAFILSTRQLMRNIAISMYFQASRMLRGGEYVKIGEYEGEIQSIRPLYTKIKSGDAVYYIPNTELITEVIEYEGE